jgi:hypothetical protein
MVGSNPARGMDVFLCVLCVCRYRPLRRADYSSKEVLPCVSTRLQNLRCEAAKVFRRTVNYFNSMSSKLYKDSLYSVTSSYHFQYFMQCLVLLASVPFLGYGRELKFFYHMKQLQIKLV